MLALREKGWTLRQIAGEMGLTRDQVKQALARDRRKRRLLAQGLVPLPPGRPPGPYLGRRVIVDGDRVTVYDYFKKEDTP